MLKSLVRFSIRQRNLFPAVNGVSSTMGPTTILTGLPMPDISYFPLEFGDYVHTHDHPTITNQLTPARSTGAIALGPANRNGGWHFMSLTTGFRILRYKWTVLPVTKDVITRVHELAFPSAANTSPPQSLAFTWTDGSFVTLSSPAPEGSINHHTSDHPQTSEDSQNKDDDEFSLTNPNVSTSESHDVPIHVSEHDLDKSEHDSLNQDQIESDLLQNIQDETNNVDHLSETKYDEVSDCLNAPHCDFDNDSDSATDQRSEQRTTDLQEQRSEVVTDDDRSLISEDQKSDLSTFNNITDQESQRHNYNLRDNPSRSSQTTFNSRTYNYSFLQCARDVSANVENTVNSVAKAVQYNNIGITNEYQPVKRSARRNCLNIITTELKHLTEGQKYHEFRLRKALIRLCHILLVENKRDLGDRSEGATCLTQMSATKGIKMFGEKVLEAMIAEYEQLDQLKVFAPVDTNKLTFKEKKQALNAIDLIK